MKFRVDAWGLFAGGYCNSLEEARALKNKAKKKHSGTIIVELEEIEYTTLIENHETQLQKNIIAIKAVQQENKTLKNQIQTLQNTLIRPEVVEEIRNQAHRQINVEVEAGKKIKTELTSEIETLVKREKGLREALGRWHKKATGEDLQPPKDLKQKGFYYRINSISGRKRKIKMYFLEKYLPLPFETGLNVLEEYALLELAEGVKLTKIYLDRGKWVAHYESINPLK